MKKKNLIYLLLIVTLLFSFNHKVYAAQELTCVYKTGDTFDPKVILVQEKDGKITVFYNDTHNKDESGKIIEVGFEDEGWKVRGEQDYLFNKEVERNDDGSLNACPNYSDGKYRTEFFEKQSRIPRREKLLDEESFKGVRKPLTSSMGTANTDTPALSACYEAGDSRWEKELLDTNAPENYCLYAKNINYGGKNVCRIIQIKGTLDGKNITAYTNINQAFTEIDSNKVTYNSITDIFEGKCPLSIKVNQKYDYLPDGTPTIKDQISFSGTGEDYVKVFQNWKNSVTGEQEYGLDDIKPDFGFKFNELKSCDELFSGDSGQYLLDILIFIRKAIQIGVPIMLLVLGTIDMAKAVFAESEDAMKKAQSKFIKRLMIGVGFFLIPVLLEFLLTLAHSIWGNISPDLCGII